MREFKFRAWDKINKTFDYFTLNDFLFDPNHISNQHRDDFIIDQYTGLKDKNGKEIYEGDIIKFNPDKYKQGYHYGDPEEVFYRDILPDSTFEIGETATVEFDDSNGGFLPFTDYDFDCGIYNNSKDFEIIGNIHENQKREEI